MAGGRSVCCSVATIGVAIVLACGGGTEPDRESTSDAHGLEPIPRPDLSDADAAIREQLEPERANLDALLASGADEALMGPSLGQMGQLYHAYDLLASAAPSYRNASVLTPKDARWPYYLGMIYQQQGRYDDAVHSLLAALERQPDDPPTLLRLGQTELERAHPEPATRYFERALRADPSCVAARYGLGQAAQALDDYEAAAEAFAQTLAQQPQATQVRYPLAQVLLRLGRHDDAHRHLDTSATPIDTSASPTCPDPLDAEIQMLATGAPIHLARGREAADAGRFDLELEEYRKAVAAAPDDHLAQHSLGFSLARHGELVEAATHYRQAVALDGENADLHYDLGVLLLRLRRSEEALEALSTALALRPDFDQARGRIAAVLASLRRCDEALPIFDRLLAAEPTNDQARTQRALCLAQLGRRSEAVSELAALLDRRLPSEPAETLRIAGAIGTLGRPELAVDYLRRLVVDLEDRALLAQIHLQLAVMLQQTGDLDGAMRSLEVVLDLDPDSQPARELLDRLARSSL